MMTEKYPTWLIGHVKEWAEKRLPTVTLCSAAGNELRTFFLNSTKKCWTGLSLTAFPPAAASRNCGSAWIRSVSIGTPYPVWYCHKSSRFHKAMRHCQCLLGYVCNGRV